MSVILRGLEEPRMDCGECGQNVGLNEPHSFVDCALYCADNTQAPFPPLPSEALTVSRPRAPKCVRCGKKIRKGGGVLVRSFGSYEGLTENGRGFAPWLVMWEHVGCPNEKEAVPSVSQGAENG